MNIITGGYFTFHVGIILDRRILWIKISHEYIFGSTDPPTRRLTDRNICMNNLVSQGKYPQTVKKILKANNICDRLADRELWETAQCPIKCGNDSETTDHVFTLPAATRQWRELTNIITDWAQLHIVILLSIA